MGKPVGFLATDFMTYTELKNTIDSVLANNAITDKSSEIIKHIKLMEDSINKYEIHFLAVVDSEGNRVSPTSLTVLGDDIKLADGIYFIYQDNAIVFSVDSQMVLYISRG